MKRPIRAFFLVFIGGLMLAPAFNLLSRVGEPESIKWKRKFLFNIDPLVGIVARGLLPFGISADPGQVVIGRDGWLYLGDLNDTVRTRGRRGATQEDFDHGRRVGAAMEAWDQWMGARGVRLFKVMVGPDKETVYPEYLPDWARSQEVTPIDALLAGTGETRFIDLRDALQARREDAPHRLYYRTDTHWNSLGAGIAFLAFADAVAPDAPDLRWPGQEWGTMLEITRRSGGDLAYLLRSVEQVPDEEPVVMSQLFPVETRHTDLDSGTRVREGGNPQVSPPMQPLLVTSEGAMNTRRVLWLRDSFGTALSPWMSATFSDVLHVDWRKALKPDGRLAELVEGWKPDYVFITMVERGAGAPELETMPPP